MSLQAIITIVGAFAGVVTWFVVQDRRIESLKAQIKESQTREACAKCHVDVTARLAAFDKDSALISAELNSQGVTLREVRQMMVDLQASVSKALRQRLDRQPTNPGFDPNEI